MPGQAMWSAVASEARHRVGVGGRDRVSESAVAAALSRRIPNVCNRSELPTTNSWSGRGTGTIDATGKLARQWVGELKWSRVREQRDPGLQVSRTQDHISRTGGTGHLKLKQTSRQVCRRHQNGRLHDASWRKVSLVDPATILAGADTDVFDVTPAQGVRTGRDIEGLLVPVDFPGDATVLQNSIEIEFQVIV